MLNFNVGILGHVDSGKTTLAQALSTVASTAAFDKNPQSKERGITLDLGFSSFSSDNVQYTLVDCPGHASLIKTIIGGAQIIDLMVLVVDVTKGIQTQTAECLVIGQITCRKMIVVLNKIDQIDPVKKEKVIEKMTKKMTATLAPTTFKDSPVVSVSAKSGVGLENLLCALKSATYIPERNPEGGFVFNVDHCFGIKGQGTVMTGTIIQGSVSIGDNVEISSLKEVRKVKSIQMFKKPVDRANQGDRIGLCVTQFDANLLERGLVSSPGFLPTIFSAIVMVRRISYYKGDINSKAKFHISLGHETVLSTVTFLETNSDGADDFDFNLEFQIAPELLESRKSFALLEFERPIVVVPGCKVLGSKLDSDIHKNLCRLAFEGKLVHIFKNKDYLQKELKELKIFKIKQKRGICERLVNDYEVIAKNMFKKETNISIFAGLTVTLSTGDVGIIDGSFGQSGKFKIRLKDEISKDAKEKLSSKGKKGDKGAMIDPLEVTLDFKKYVFSDKMVQ